MIRLRSFLSLVLCSCILFGLSSVSAYASEVDGYTVNTYYYVDSEVSKESFEGSITFLEEVSSFYIQADIFLTETLKRDTTFDFTSYWMFDTADVSLESMLMFDEDLSFAGEASPSFDGSCVEVLGATNTSKPCSIIRLTFKILNPTFVTGSSTYSVNFYVHDGDTTSTLVGNTGGIFEVTVTDTGFNYSGSGVWNGSYTASGSDFLGLSKTSGTSTPDYPIGSTFTWYSPETSASGWDLYCVYGNSGSGGDIGEDVPTYIYNAVCNSVSVTEVSTGGLLSSIIAWIKKIWTSITELPSKIADAIINGIKSLFIPSEQSMIDFKAEFEALLADRFGAVYESVAIIDDFAESIKEADATNTISMPETTVNLAGADFTFGGWEVQIVPKGFNVLVEALKLMISVVCTFAFVMGMKKRFEGVLG